MKAADVPGYTDSYTRFAKLKKEGKLIPSDQPPRPSDFGLIDWAAEHVRKRIDREMNR
jgi:hypothetical protein